LKSAHISRKRETRENRLNHRTDVGDVFCHSLTSVEEISLAHIHKKRFLSLSPSFSGHCRRRRREIATSSFVILSEHRSSREKEKSRTYPNDWMRSVFWPECIFILFTTHALLPIKEAQCVCVCATFEFKKEITIYQFLSVGNRRAKRTAASTSVGFSKLRRNRDTDEWSTDWQMSIVWLNCNLSISYRILSVRCMIFLLFNRYNAQHL
jgi:hypothetical protein